MKFRWFAALVLASFLASIAQAAPHIETGAELVSACEDFAKLDERALQNAVHPHHCHYYLMRFFWAFGEGERAAKASGTQSNSPSPACIHLPDYLSYRDLAGRIVAHAKREPSTLSRPGAVLVRRTLEHDFPCAGGTHDSRK